VVGNGTEGAAQVVVRDHGLGVDSGSLTEMFKPFWRAPRDGQSSDGAGLGLALTERVVATHGGRVSASNATDGGLVMTIDVPITASS
jgi:signal transduction histidine kinase